MKKLLIFILVLCLTLCGCTPKQPKRVEAAEAMPIQGVIDGVVNGDAVTWRQSFLPAYDEAFEKQEIMLGTCTDYNAYVEAKLVDAKNIHVQNYGEDFCIEFSDVTVKGIALSERPDMFEEYKDIFTLSYRLDLDSVEEACEVSGSISIWGSLGSETKPASYVVVKYLGKWYLHPAFYNLTF